MSDAPWTRTGVQIPQALLDRVDAEACAAFARDEESCGLLVGPAGDTVVDEIVPMVNRANQLHALDPDGFPRTGRMYFDIDPMKFERAVVAGTGRGRPVKVLYHSHLDVGAYFSETDASAATMGGDAPTYELAYLVTSVRAGRVDDRKLFVWSRERGTFVEIDLVVVPSTS